MIVAMKKVTLIAMQNERESALDALRDLGVMQIELCDRFSEETSAANDRYVRIRKVEDFLDQLARENKISDVFVAEGENASLLIEECLSLQENIHNWQNECSELYRRIDAISQWGDFDRGLLNRLNNAGVKIVLCAGNNDDLQKALELESAQVHIVRKEKGKVAFIVVALENLEMQGLPIVNLAMDDDPRILKERVKKLEADIEKSNIRLMEISARRGCIASVVEESAELWEFCRVRDSIADHGEIVTLSGFVPVTEMEKICKAAKDKGWGFLARDPEDDEEVPVLIKDNKFTRLVKPLFDFLGIVPGYREIDISGGVLIFFTVFYAIIIGDAGYGVLFGIVSLLGLWGARKVPKLRPPMRLLLVLSVASIIWGALCGSWFGMSMIPGTDRPFPALECFRDFAASSAKQANIQFFCFILAVVQLSVGRIWRVIRERNWRAAGQHLGWMLIIWGNFFLTVRLIVYPGEFPEFMYVLYGLGLVMVMCCGVNWKQASDIFQFPFDIIGSFTDVLSYIRLFAVGLAGACIAGSFNGMAFDLCQVSSWLLPAGIVVVLIGHALNIALALLSVLVHAVRLNTLEFSNHTGLSWSGQTFNPFKSNKQHEE